MSVEADGVEAAADWETLESPENYLGYERTDNFESARSRGADASITGPWRATGRSTEG